MSVEKDKKYGLLTTIKVVGKTTNRNLIWECVCDCGNKINVPTASLTTGNTKSCGCLHSMSMKELGQNKRKLNKYDLSKSFGIGYTSKNEPFYFDLEDHDLIKNFTWSYNDQGYVFSIPFGKQIRMHNVIMGSNDLDDIDHINGIRHDNRKQNLRPCKHFQNIINSKTYSNNTSGRKGVYWDKTRNKWMAIITVNKQTINLGRFDNFKDAVLARENAEKIYHKEFSNKNNA